ncbi:S-type anion channel SLAH2-like [Salvia miltiorrhiza]|uniref:S-type anion channel SLAH2-like n=1 Tax=Salvia miltiorrhiza TaxID=226208 RepID=UPI0025ABC1A7|nr:S-type anion channel SLAH2-like [Salvia miltiorrhiza]
MAAKEDFHDGLPPLIKAITANEVDGFDSFREHKDFKWCEETASVLEIEAASMEKEGEDKDPQQTRFIISISMPPSPVEANRVLFTRDDEQKPQPKGVKFHSQPMPKPCAINPVYDKRFDSFKTWSGKLERQFSNLRSKQYRQTEQPPSPSPEFENLPVHRYFDALEGPELDTLRASEEILLPDDKQWPFLLRFPISSFGICLGVGSQAKMWKNLSSSATALSFLNVTPHINLALWLISAALTLTVAIIYALKLIFYFEAVRREYYHPVRVNFFFAPWISLLFLALAVPPSIAQTLPSYLWYILMAPILCLELKIYGQWMSGGQRRLSKVANPSNHLSVVGNFVGALLGASMGLKEGPIFFFAVGMAHYIVLFVTLYQRLPTNETLPKELHPVFFLFVAAPSVASMAWAEIQGSFDYGSRIAYFIAMFLYVSLAVRVNFFRGFRFSLAWWAYTFPMTAAAIATIKYSSVVTCRATQIFAVMLCIVATVAVAALLGNTVIHALVHGDLFPNDMAIAISKRRPRRRWYHKKSGSSDSSIEQYLKYSESDGKDVEAALHSSSPNTQD